MSGNDFHTHLSCEPLEARDNPSGNVTADVVGGTLIVSGDGDSNRVRIEQDAIGNMFVIGLEGTTVNGQSAVLVGQGTPNGISVNLNDGPDYLEMANLFAGAISVQGGNGGDGLFLTNVGAAGNIEVNSGADNDTVFLSGVTAGNVLSLDGGNAYDILHVDTSGGYGGSIAVNFEQPF